MSCVGDINPMNNAKVTEEGQRDEEHEVYPYEVNTVGYGASDGEQLKYLVLGPDTFASTDGDVITWRGVNYYRMGSINADQ